MAVLIAARDDGVCRERTLGKGWLVPCWRLRGRRSARSPVFRAKPSRRRGIGKDAVRKRKREEQRDAKRAADHARRDEAQQSHRAGACGDRSAACCVSEIPPSGAEGMTCRRRNDAAEQLHAAQAQAQDVSLRRGAAALSAWRLRARCHCELTLCGVRQWSLEYDAAVPHAGCCWTSRSHECGSLSSRLSAPNPRSADGRRRGRRSAAWWQQQQRKLGAAARTRRLTSSAAGTAPPAPLRIAQHIQGCRWTLHLALCEADLTTKST